MVYCKAKPKLPERFESSQRQSMPQRFLPIFDDIHELHPDLADAIDRFASASDASRGAVYTKPEVVRFILDLCGYTEDQPLANRRLLEPSFGGGDFLFPVVERLLKSTHKVDRNEVAELLRDSVRAVELDPSVFASVHEGLKTRLEQAAIPASDTQWILSHWLRRDDFLLTTLDSKFDFVVGNPPYVRQEMVPDILLAEYRRRYRTIFDRADLYIPFIERGLCQLAERGVLGFICSDRWTKNRYGGPLRKLVADGYHLKCFVDMYGTEAFNTEVVAYPAITIIERTRGVETRIVRRPLIEEPELAEISAAAKAPSVPYASRVEVAIGVVADDQPWLMDCPEELLLVRRLESIFPTLEEAGCQVGIGVATGADKVFIAPYDDLDVEPECKLPLAMTRDIDTGQLAWRGYGVINPFQEDGRLVDLASKPKLRRYLESHETCIKNRHVARKNPNRWYRTIDRITPSLTTKPKLLIPDIKGESNIVFDPGECYPHHNLYYIVSEDWDLRALKALLLSGIARLFVATYSTKMRGGYLRFQAQYLRRIRVPRWSDLTADHRRRLIQAAESGDLSVSNRIAFEIYGLTSREQELILQES